MSVLSGPGLASAVLGARYPPGFHSTHHLTVQVYVRKAATHFCLVRDSCRARGHWTLARVPLRDELVGMGIQPDSLAPLGLPYSRKVLGKERRPL